MILSVPKAEIINTFCSDEGTGELKITDDSLNYKELN